MSCKCKLYEETARRILDNRIKELELQLSKKDDIDFEWNLHHDMQNRHYEDVTELEILKKQTKQLNTENELHKTWVFHHGKAWEIRMSQLHHANAKIKALEDKK